MSRPVLFSDLDKTVSEFFSKGYFGTDNKLAFKTKAPGDQTVEVKATRKADGKISGEEILARSFTNNGITYKTEGNFSFDGKVAGTLTITDVYKGLELSANADTTTKFSAENVTQDQNGKLALKFKQDTFTVTSDVTKKRGGKLVLGASSTFAYNSFTFGGSVKAETPSSANSSNNNNNNVLKYNYEVGASYSTRDTVLTVKATDSMNVLALGYHQRLNSNLQVATLFSHSVNEKDTSKRYTTQVGMNYVIDPESSVKGSLASNGIAKLSYSTKLNKNFTATLSTKLDATDLSKGAEVGAEFKFEA